LTSLLTPKMILHFIILALLWLDTKALTETNRKIHQYNDAASKVRDRVWQKILSQRNRSFTSNSNTLCLGSTRIGKVAKAFESVATTSKLKRGAGIIKTPELLQACRVFSKAMKEIGQDAVAKDLEKNVRKLDKVYQSAPKEIRNSLRSLLEYEKNNCGSRLNNKRLKDPSAAMGGLWIQRSLSFNSDFYSGILAERRKPSDAALAAYKRQLEPFHGWTLRRLYKLSLGSLTPPSQKEAFRRMGGFSSTDDSFGAMEEKAARRDIQYAVRVWNPLLKSWKSLYRDLDLEDNRRV